MMAYACGVAVFVTSKRIGMAVSLSQPVDALDRAFDSIVVDRAP